jgi:hypothetical protein
VGATAMSAGKVGTETSATAWELSSESTSAEAHRCRRSRPLLGGVWLPWSSSWPPG